MPRFRDRRGRLKRHKLFVRAELSPWRIVFRPAAQARFYQAVRELRRISLTRADSLH
jgi:hypothetical protein